MAGITIGSQGFWFHADERLGKAVFWCWFFGFYLAFMPLYVLGLMGATRAHAALFEHALAALSSSPSRGAILILLGIALTGVQLAVSIRQRELNRDVTGDPWNGRTLEWGATPSPAAGVELLASAASDARGRVLGHEATARNCAGSQHQADL